MKLYAAWTFLSYIIRHKYFVGRELIRMGLYRQAITHDLSKLLPNEFIPNVIFTDAKNNKAKDNKTKKKKIKSEKMKEIRSSFLLSRLIHCHRNRHHYVYWRMANGVVRTFPMPEKYIKEMVADWLGQQRAITGKSMYVEETIRKAKEKDKSIKMHWESKLIFNQLMDELAERAGNNL